jgi:hypothetical protein
MLFGLSFPALLALVNGSNALGRGYGSKVVFREPVRAEAGGMVNIQVSYEGKVDGELSINYGNCTSEAPEAHHRIGSTHIGSHSLAKRHLDWKDQRPTTFVWLPPHDAPDGGCLHAYVDEKLVGISLPISMTRRIRKRSFADAADWQGPWFDGVQYLQQKEPSDSFVASTKNKKFGIIGGGMSGLMTAVSDISLNERLIEGARLTDGIAHPGLGWNS